MNEVDKAARESLRMRAAYESGYMAELSGQPLSSNPYKYEPAKEQESGCWIRGWYGCRADRKKYEIAKA